jgi:hypothetical protein
MVTPLHRSQYEVGANARPSDCGQTCCGMHLAALGINVTIDSIRGGTSTGLTDADDLVRIFAVYGVQAHYEMLDSLEQVKPNSILLVSYAPIRGYAQSVNFKGWHWLINLGIVGNEVETHDPLYWGNRANEGNRKRYPLEAMRKAFRPYGGTGTAVVVDGLMPLPESKAIQGKPYRVIGDVNYRQWYSIAAGRIGELSAGLVVIGYDRTYTNGGRTWREVDHGGATGWVADEYLKVLS